MLVQKLRRYSVVPLLLGRKRRKKVMTTMIKNKVARRIRTKKRREHWILILS